MPGIDLAAIAERLRTLNAPDQGMNYSGGSGGDRRYNETTGEPYWTRSRPAELTVYGDRANFLYQLIRDGETIAEAIAALQRPNTSGEKG